VRDKCPPGVLIVEMSRSNISTITDNLENEEGEMK